MIRLHQFEISPFCDKVRRALHWKGVPYEVVEVPVTRASRVRRLNPAGKLPVLEHDGRVVADSTDIAEHLEEAFPEPPLYPKGARERGLCAALEDWADESLYFYELTLRFTRPHNARRWLPELVKHDPAWFQRLARWVGPRAIGRTARAQGVGRKPPGALLRDLEREVEALAGLLEERQWLVGEALTIADLAVFVQVFCLRGAEEGERLLAARPVVTRWMERVDRATAAPRAPSEAGA